jgi:hypothetical protein
MKTILCWLTVISLVSMISFKARSEEAVTTTTTSTVKTTDTTMTFTPDERRIIRQKVIIKKPVTTQTTVTKITRGQVMAPDIYSVAVPVDQKILVELPQQPPSTKLVVVGDQVVRVQEPGHQILDVFDVDEIEDKIP